VFLLEECANEIQQEKIIISHALYLSKISTYHGLVVDLQLNNQRRLRSQREKEINVEANILEMLKKENEGSKAKRESRFQTI